MQKFSIYFFAAIVLSFTAIPPLYSQPVIGFQTITSGLSNPVDVVNAGGPDLYIVQQGGIIRRWDGSSLSDYINLSGVITAAGSEQGLLSVAFHPLYTSNGYFFVWYTNTAGDITLARYRRSSINPLVGDPASGQVMISLPKPGAFANHNGAKINFGPDGMLYVGTGDGGSAGDPFNLAQSGASLFGKMLRLNVSSFPSTAPYYTIPANNPYLVAGDGILDEIYNFGLRNPWRWSFDRLNGNMWIADVGQNLYEEINYKQAGTTSATNYGWRCREGFHAYNATGCTSGYTDPVFEYPHNGTTGGFSITGGYVYRGTEFPSFNGYYIATDYVSSNLWLVSPSFTTTMQSGALNNIAGFGESFDGSVLYAVRRPTGVLYKVIVTGSVPLNLVNFNAVKRGNFNEIKWQTSSEINTSHFLVEYSFDNRSFSEAGSQAASGNTTGTNYTFHHFLQNRQTVFYRLKMVDRNGEQKYSPILRLGGKAAELQVYPSIVTGNTITLELPAKGIMAELLDASGKKLKQFDLRQYEGVNLLQLPVLQKGIYFMRFTGAAVHESRKIVVQ